MWVMCDGEPSLGGLMLGGSGGSWMGAGWNGGALMEPKYPTWVGNVGFVWWVGVDLGVRGV
jgi:hypothetical protein